VLFYEGFLDLTAERTMGEALGPIPILAMFEYCLYCEIEGDQRDDFIWLMKRLDSKYLEHHHNKKGD